MFCASVYYCGVCNDGVLIKYSRRAAQGNTVRTIPHGSYSSYNNKH